MCYHETAVKPSILDKEGRQFTEGRVYQPLNPSFTYVGKLMHTYGQVVQGLKQWSQTVFKTYVRVKKMQNGRGWLLSDNQRVWTLKMTSHICCVIYWVYTWCPASSVWNTGRQKHNLQAFSCWFSCMSIPLRSLPTKDTITSTDQEETVIQNKVKDDKSVSLSLVWLYLGWILSMKIPTRYCLPSFCKYQLEIS